MRIVLEGLTGTGKTQTLAAMARLGLLPGVVVREEETFGELMEELDHGPLQPAHLVRRLVRVCESVVEADTPSFLLERFHLSYFALVPRWELFEDLDARLAARQTGLVLLHVPDEELETRSLKRREYGGTDWQAFAERYGSEQQAILALKSSQDRRIEALGRTRMSHLVIDTSAEDWEGYAQRVCSWAK